ncbi:MAG: NADPH-dependent F420 reductase [Chloroflexi bacterium]|nr:NADPH-dependent F420 reductase [Chloroflexota bacterium]
MIGFLGGTGPEGRGLALRFALAGEEVIIGSREATRAQEAARSVSTLAPGLRVKGATNREAAAASIVIVTVPYAGHRETLASLAHELSGKVVIDVVAPLAFSKGRARAIPVESGSVAQEAQALLPNSRIVSAFHNVSAEDLLEPAKVIDCDVVVCSDDKEAKAQVMALAETIKGVRAVDGDGLENSRYLEDLTALLLNINRIYKGHSMIKIVGI